MNRFTMVYILVLCGAAVTSGLAQTNSSTQPQSPVAEEFGRRAGTRTGRSAGGGRWDDAAAAVFARRTAFAVKERLSREQKKRLAPDAADANRYAAFLGNPNAGLIKLFPDLDCENDARVVRADEVCLNQIPMSAFYSFREREHTTDFLSDIRLKNEVLISDGLLMQSIMVGLGETDLQSVTPNSAGLKFLNEYQPEAQSEKAFEQALALTKGIESDGFVYGKALPARANMTYALRIIAYRGKAIQRVRGFPFNLVEGDDRVDVTIAFRLLKKDQETGSYTLLWKELGRRQAPKIIFPKKDKRQKFQRTK